jgi:hypothetical protein
MSVELERGPVTGPAAVTFSFADPAAQLYGLARLGLSGEGEARRGSALALLFAGREPVAAIAEGDVPVAADADWELLELPGLATSVEAPFERWSVRMAGARHEFALSFEAASPPADRPLTGGAEGYEQLCRVRGEVLMDGDGAAVDGTGQRGHEWGTHDWTRLDGIHTVSGWMEDGASFAVTAARPAGAEGHDADERWGALLGPTAVATIADARLSTTYDAAGHQRRAGLELWIDAESEYPRRAAGTALCGSTLELGQLRLECAFMRWTMDGIAGVGRYDVLRRA